LRPSTSWPSADAPLEATEAELLPGQPHRPRLERRDPVGGHEQVTTADPRLQAGNRRIAAIGQTYDQVLDATKSLSRSIEQRAAQDRR
jgi:hypothetical protein